MQVVCVCVCVRKWRITECASLVCACVRENPIHAKTQYVKCANVCWHLLGAIEATKKKKHNHNSQTHTHMLARLKFIGKKCVHLSFCFFVFVFFV